MDNLAAFDSNLGLHALVDNWNLGLNVLIAAEFMAKYALKNIKEFNE